MLEIMLFIFDADGVLIDSSILSMRRHQYLAKFLGQKVPTIDQLRKRFGLPWEKYVHAIASDIGWHPVAEKFFIELNRDLPKTEYPKFKGLSQALEELDESCDPIIQMAIVSNRSRNSLDRILKKSGINRALFTSIQSFDDCEFKKPDPRALDPAIEELGTPIENTWLVGDTILDLQAAQNHDPPVRFIGITSGTVTFEEFIDAGVPPNRILRTAAHLPKILNILDLQ